MLSYKDNIISFEFAALDYHSPLKNQYAYQMEGVDPDWVHTDASRRFATYTNLDPGEYTFRVKGSNNDGVWNEAGTSIKIIITPPWWRTNAAYAAYLFVFVIISAGTWRAQMIRQQLKQQARMEHFEAEKLREVDQLKSRFFANISHEFRTPLTLIKGPIRQMLDGQFIGNARDQYKMILRNSDRLLGLINQILDLSRLESGEMKLQVAETDIVPFLKSLVLSFSPLADAKKVNLKFMPAERQMIGYIDRDKLEKIVTNLLSNAFKFTPEGGEVIVDCGYWGMNESKIQNPKSKISLSNSKIIKITVSNEGPGIPPDQVDKIFDRFYRADDHYRKDGEGSGIGLALTRELVEVCRGRITVTSIPDEITRFTVTLPVAGACFSPDEMADSSQAGASAGDGLPAGEPERREPETESRDIDQGDTEAAAAKTAPLLLIVEDNPDVTRYISGFMNREYRLITADNGKGGLEKALDRYPDLIISDVMMPEMDGFELCRRVKSDQRISHIPVILLTAKADPDSRIEGLEYGADDYISKPFDADELKVRAGNLIDLRRQLREKFSTMTEIRPGEMTAGSMDEQFLQRLLDVFEDHISEPDFSTESLAREIGMSRSNLYRKIQALTSQSTHQFIMSLRLKRAARLLRDRTATISEIAYDVGFSSPSHFSRMFRRRFGRTPSEYIRQSRPDSD